MQDLKDAAKRKMSFGATLKAILWAFFGVRKKSGYEQDTAQLNPVYLIVAGLIAAVVFIVTLLLVVKSVVAN